MQGVVCLGGWNAKGVYYVVAKSRVGNLKSRVENLRYHGERISSRLSVAQLAEHSTVVFSIIEMSLVILGRETANIFCHL